MAELGRIVVLNGAPRSGKTSIAIAMQEAFAEPWMNLGVDAMALVTPPRLRPGIGLRPGGERPDLEPFVVVLYDALYAAVAAYSRLGLDVVVDVGHHDDHSQPLGILPRSAAALAGLPAWLVGVRCPIDVIMLRRDAGSAGREGTYATSQADGSVPEPVARWQRAVHHPGIYDVEVDTSILSAGECAAAIRERLDDGGRPTAFDELAAQVR